MKNKPQSAPDTLSDSDYRALASLAKLLDNSIKLPGGIRIGLDGIIGLIPGIGDLVGSVLSSYIVVIAARNGVSPSTLALMVYNTSQSRL